MTTSPDQPCSLIRPRPFDCDNDGIEECYDDEIYLIAFLPRIFSNTVADAHAISNPDAHTVTNTNALSWRFLQS